jgi:NADPH2:quinone reductase
MKAIVLDSFGSADVLQLRDVDRPEPGPGEILVKVHATSVSPVDTKIREHGSAYALEPPIILGYDVSGVVEAVGDGVGDLAEGDEVFYTPALNAHGAYAEYHVARSENVAFKPQSLSHEKAAAIPLAACTAWQALIDRAGLQAAETVLIHGGGGVGHFAVQIAYAAGAQVVVVGSADMEDALLDLGADEFVDYEKGGFEDVVDEVSGGLGADVVFDTVGGTTLADSIPTLAQYGRMVTIVGDATGDFGAAYRKNVAIYPMMMERGAAMLDRLGLLVDNGQLRPLIDRTLKLEDAAEAHRLIEQGGLKGKIVLTP